MSWFRPVLAGLAGGAAWIVGIFLVFGPAQRWLSDPSLQSEKFLAVFSRIEPLPRAVAAPWVLPLGILAIGVVYGVVYARLERAFAGGAVRKGVGFGLAAWALMVPWFEFYLPWNVMHEPFALVLLEMAAWLLVLLLVGITVAFVHRRLGGRRAEPAA